MADDILKEALEVFDECESTEKDNRTAALDDLKFARLGREHQWPANVYKQRQADGRPCLTINKMPAFIRQVVNDSRQNKPGISVHPVEDGDEKTAEVMSGLIRSIETQSNADIAYDTAVDNSATMGFGYIGINLDYACDDTFEKDIIIKAKPNPFAIYGDPYSQAADSSDWMVAFEIDEMKEEAFKRRFKGAKVSDFGSGSWANGWCDQQAKKARVAAYWKREEVIRNLVQYTHGESGGVQVTFEDELEQLQKSLGEIQVIGQPRPSKSYKVKQYTLTANEVLDTIEWAGKYIPIVPVYGEEVNVEGKRHFRSLIRDAKDPQQMFNFFRTNASEIVAYAPRAPWIGRKGSFATDPRWQTANNASHAFLEYDGPDAPTRTPFSGMSPGDIQEAMNASDDMKAVMGIYDASLGQRSNETSGKAIMARQREGDVSTFHFIDNLSRAIRHTGKILIDLIPKVYNTERMIRTLGVDGKAQTVKITSEKDQHDPSANIYNLTVGKYDLVVKTGPGFTTQREEAREMLTSLVQASKEMAPLVADIMVDLMDLPGGDKLVKRLQAMLPDAVKQMEASDNPEAAAAMQQVQTITQQAQEALGQMQQALQEAQAAADDNRTKNFLDQRKIDIEEYKAVTERLTAQMTAAAPMMTPEMVQQIIMETLQDAIATSDEIPGGDEPQGMGMPGVNIEQGMPPMQQPMEPMPQDMGQPEMMQP